MVEAEIEMNRRETIVVRFVDRNELLKKGKKCWEYKLKQELIVLRSLPLSPLQCYAIG